MNASHSSSRDRHVCPWWLIYTFDNPLRRLVQKPERVLDGLIGPGDRCLDLGCGFGYFTIPMARLAGPAGRVTAVDLQPEMLAGVRRRAAKAGLESRIHLQQADAAGLHVEGAFDFALAFWMVHEVPDQDGLLRQVQAVLKPGGRLLLAEPRGHVSQGAFDRTVALAGRVGFTPAAEPRIFFSRAVLLTSGEGRCGTFPAQPQPDNPARRV